MVVRTRVSLPAFELGWARIQQCHLSHRTQETPLSTKLLGVSGVGKTYLLSEYKAEHPPRNVGEITVLPVLHIAVPSAPTKRGIYKAVLAAMGVEDPRGSADDLRHRVSVLANNCKVELLMVDEVQHFIDRGSAKTYASAADALKELLDLLMLPVIFAGAPRSQILFDHNSQLRSRVMSTLQLRPFTPDEDFDQLRGYLYAVADNFSQDQRIFLASKQIALRIFYATDGIHRTINMLLQLVFFELQKEKNSHLDIQMLAKVFEMHFGSADAKGASNPFTQDFPMRRLNEPGELHQPTVLDGDNHTLTIFSQMGVRKS